MIVEDHLQMTPAQMWSKGELFLTEHTHTCSEPTNIIPMAFSQLSQLQVIYRIYDTHI